MVLEASSCYGIHGGFRFYAYTGTKYVTFRIWGPGVSSPKSLWSGIQLARVLSSTSNIIVG